MGTRQGQHIPNPIASFSGPQTKVTVNLGEDALLSPKCSPEILLQPDCLAAARMQRGRWSQVCWRPSSQRSSRELLGNCSQPAGPCLWAGVCGGGKGVPGPLGVPWMLTDCFCSPGSCHGFCPRRRGCDQQEMNSTICLQVVQSPPSKSEDDSGYFPRLHHQTTTEGKIKMEVHPTYMIQVLNPHVWILLDVKFSITSTGVLRWRISRFVPN